MALGRETIGTAYVRILADGSGLDKSVKKEMRGTDDTMRGIGAHHNQAYWDGWDDESLKHRDFFKTTDLEDSLKRGVGRFNRMGAFVGTQVWEGIREELESEFGEVGTKIGQNLEQGLQRGEIGLEGLDQRLRNIRPDFARATEELRRMREEQDKDRDSLGRITRSLDDFADGLGTAFGKGSRNNFINFVGSFVSGLARIPVALVKVGQKIAEFGEKVATTFTDAEGGLSGIWAVAKQVGPQLIGAGVAFVALAGLVGVATSAFWLLLGAITAVISSITFGLIGALAPLVGLLGPIGVAAAAVGFSFIGLSNKTKKLMKEALKPLKDDLKALGDAARPGILRGLQTAAENLHQPMRQLGPLFTAAGDGLATFAGAFTDALTGPGFTQFVNVMTRQLPSEMHLLGDSLGHVFDGFLGTLAALNRKGGPVEQFLGWLSGISATFDEWASGKAVAPSIDLAGGIKEPAAAPETGLEGFLDKIQTSAEALTGVLGPLWDIIRQLLNAGQPAGDSLLTSLGDTLQDLADWMTEHPEDVQQWMSDSEDFARALGDLVGAFIDFADALDTPGGRKASVFLLKLASVSFATSAATLAGLAAAMGLLGSVDWNGIGNGLERVKNGITGIPDALGKLDLKIPGGMKISWSDLINLPSAGRNLIQSLVVKAFSGGAKWAKDAMGKFDLSGIVSGAGKVLGAVVGPFRRLAPQALASMGTFNVVNIIVGLGSVAKEIFDAFPSASEILHSIGTFDIMDVVDGLAGVSANIINAFPGASEILAAIGHIDLTSLMHGSFTLPGGHKISWAQGGVAFGPMTRLIGEAGPEAVVPLARPLHLVDPAVRELSAFAQGLRPMASGGVVGGPAKVVDVGGITVITPTTDPVAVAQETMNRLVAVGY